MRVKLMKCPWCGYEPNYLLPVHFTEANTAGVSRQYARCPRCGMIFEFLRVIRNED